MALLRIQLEFSQLEPHFRLRETPMFTPTPMPTPTTCSKIPFFFYLNRLSLIGIGKEKGLFAGYVERFRDLNVEL